MIRTGQAAEPMMKLPVVSAVAVEDSCQPVLLHSCHETSPKQYRISMEKIFHGIVHLQATTALINP